MLVRLCSKSFKLLFSSMWTENFQINKLSLQKAEDQEIKLWTSVGSSKKQESSRKISTSALGQSLWLCGLQQTMEILQEIETPDHMTCLLRNLYAGQEATVRTGHGTIDWFQIGKGVHQGCILSPCLFNLYAENIMWNAGLDESQGSKEKH